MVTLDEARADPLLTQLSDGVQVHVTLLTDAADRDRLIQAMSSWRAIAAAHGRPPLTS